MERFRNTLESCNLCDLGYRGSKFTWNNRREATHFSKKRLDWATATSKWCSLYPDVDVAVLVAITSDHKPLLIRFSAVSERWVQKKLFKFEAKWNIDDECGDLIKFVLGCTRIQSQYDAEHTAETSELHACIKSWSVSNTGMQGSSLKQKQGV
ncbi:hypothetical protein SLA2020_268940 [Shorea laevis]